MGSIFINEMVEDTTNKTRYRILWIAPDRKKGFWMRLNPEKMPEAFDPDWLQRELENHLFEKREDAVPGCVDEADATDASKARRDELWAALGDILENEPDIYDRQLRKEMLRSPAELLGTSYNNLYRYLTRYWSRGKTPNAFLPDYRNCGGKRRTGGKKQGRPAIHEGGFGKSLEDEDVRNFLKAVKKYYLKKEKATLTKTYEKLLSDSYSVPDPQKPGRVRLLPPEQIPSIRQFRYWFEKTFDMKAIKQKRDGDVKFELTGRAITGRSDYQLMGPGAKYQIDATVGDIYLVSQFDRKDIIGRPVMYFVVDSYSRIVTGMYVGLEGPSWAGAMMAIENAASDKVPYCAAYGITITEDEWPCHHIPTAILGDRGEMESRFADNLVKVLGIRIENAPPYRADMKGIIEQHFRTISTNATPFLPGKVLPDMGERGGRDYRLDAKLDIRQFTQIIIQCVLYYNNSHYMDYYEKNEQMMELGVDAIPLELWNFGVRYCSGSLRTVPRDVLRQALMPSDTASVTDRGVKYKGLYYSSEEALAGLWFEKARAKGTYKARISYDPRDMGAILVEDPASREMIRCGLVDWESKYAGKQQEEVWYEQEKEKSRRKKHTVKETEAKVNLGKQIESIVESAEKMAETDRHESKAERVRNIRGNRKSERDKIRKQEAFVAKQSDEGGTKQPESPQEEELSPIMRMIQKQVEKEIKDDALYGKRTVPGTGDPGISGESPD